GRRMAPARRRDRDRGRLHRHPSPDRRVQQPGMDRRGGLRVRRVHRAALRGGEADPGVGGVRRVVGTRHGRHRHRGLSLPQRVPRCRQGHRPGAHHRRRGGPQPAELPL
ncbi:MAG: hypothetical protein AVDCRST_MAG34-2712, partial [uncultured Nocardioidaceae bacterium]